MELQTMAEEATARREAAPMNLLVVDDEQTTRDLCVAVAQQSGLKVATVATAEDALEVLEQSAVDIMLTDLKLPETSGLELLRKAHDMHPEVAVVVLTQYGTIDSAVEATRMGAMDYVTKPFRVEELRTRLERVMHAVELQQENRLLREQLRTRPGFGLMIGMSAKMERVYKMVEKVSQHEYPVLILGESGTGKELVAKSIHYSGLRKDRPFVPVDCSALVPTLIESELFGYVKGAFTGAMQAKQGLLESAHGGTLFLDEIGDMPVDLQAKLLRALQEREIKPVGSTDRRSIDVRIIAATNRDLENAIRSGSFRQDLYFRLNVVQIKLPPLRDRKSDIPLLVTAFLEKFSGSHGSVRSISDDAMRRLVAYDWPGNVRELENAIERAVALGSGPIVHVADLPSNLQFPSSERVPQKDELLPLEELERRAILRTLRETSGDKLAAARMLGIGKTTLYRKLKQYRVEPPEN
ncbi:MAG TPA: sigma-54 dependent transcriptional regulator [Terriglobales bacterium]|nr:sigma-54 dependent transcriptional regulator [Terriglobales bacterium]